MLLMHYFEQRCFLWLSLQAVVKFWLIVNKHKPKLSILHYNSSNSFRTKQLNSWFKNDIHSVSIDLTQDISLHLKFAIYNFKVTKQNINNNVEIINKTDSIIS